MLEMPTIQKKVSSDLVQQKNTLSKLQKSFQKRNRQSFSVKNYQIQIQNKKSVAYPEPVSSSQGASEQLQYLSYLVKVIDSTSEFSSQQQNNHRFMTAQYWRVLYLSAIYVKKRQIKTEIDDQLIMETIGDHFKLGAIIPQAKDQIGSQLLDNGYFLLSYAIAVARSRRSKFVFRYLMNLFYQNRQINYNRQEFQYYFEEYIEKNKIYQILDDDYETPRGQTPNKNILRRNTNPNHLRIIRLVPRDDTGTNYTKTIRIQQSDPQLSWL